MAEEPDPAIFMKVKLLIENGGAVGKLSALLAGANKATINYRPTGGHVTAGDTLLHDIVSCANDAESKLTVALA